jgi:hypothetical protein
LSQATVTLCPPALGSAIPLLTPSNRQISLRRRLLYILILTFSSFTTVSRTHIVKITQDSEQWPPRYPLGLANLISRQPAPRLRALLLPRPPYPENQRASISHQLEDLRPPLAARARPPNDLHTSLAIPSHSHKHAGAKLEDRGNNPTRVLLAPPSAPMAMDTLINQIHTNPIQRLFPLLVEHRTPLANQLDQDGTTPLPPLDSYMGRDQLLRDTGHINLNPHICSSPETHSLVH